MYNISVLKFGGTSVSRGTENIIKIIQDEEKQNKNLIIVLSAFSGITNLLYKIAEDIDNIKEKFNKYIKSYHNYFINKNIKDPDIKKRLQQIIENINISFFTTLERNYKGKIDDKKFLDLIVPYGERISLQIYKHILEQANIPCYVYSSEMLITTNNEFQNAFPIMNLTQDKINNNLIPRLKKQKIILITGYVATNSNWDITTLGRSGSDFTATIIGSCLNADRILIYTDVNGILTSDPRKNIRAKTIPQLNYKQVSELSYFGAKVIHPKTLIPIIPKEIHLYVKNTFNLNNTGTVIFNHLNNSETIIDAITSISDHKLITVYGMGMLGTFGISSRIFNLLNRMGESTPFITQASSEQTICFAIHDKIADIIKNKCRSRAFD